MVRGMATTINKLTYNIISPWEHVVADSARAFLLRLTTGSHPVELAVRRFSPERLPNIPVHLRTCRDYGNEHIAQSGPKLLGPTNICSDGAVWAQATNPARCFISSQPGPEVR